MTLTKTNNFYPFETIRDHLDNLWYDFHNNLSDAWTMPIDLLNHNDRYELKAWLPGIEREQLNIEATKRTISIQGTYKDSNGNKQYYSEIPKGSFNRKVTLPTTIEKESITADYKDGILILNLPKSSDTIPNTVKVKLPLAN